MSASPQRRPWRRALAWLVACSLLFYIVYGGCTWITAQRSDVGSWFYEWELSIPFVPWMIVPYWSIDLLFVGAFFLCTGRRELDVLARRIVLAILVAGAFFLLFPLRLGFPRPPVDGPLGLLFSLLRAFDLPYNLLPSLHITLRTILAATYARHTCGPARFASHLWFVLIGLSTLLTYQHHVVDLVGGFVLGVVCFYAVREHNMDVPVNRNWRIGGYYALCSAVIAVVARASGAWGILLTWPAVALTIVASAYWGIGPRIFRKENGRIPLSARLVLAPCLIGQRLSLRYYCRQCRPWDAVAPGVWIGRTLNDREAAQAGRQGVTAVLDLTSEFSEARPFVVRTYLNIPVLDLTAPTQPQLRQAVDFIHRHVPHGTVYIHCKIGYSRSAAVVGAYLLSSGLARDADDAVAALRAVRPSLIVRPEAMRAIQTYARSHVAPLAAAPAPSA